MEFKIVIEYSCIFNVLYCWDNKYFMIIIKKFKLLLFFNRNIGCRVCGWCYFFFLFF